MNKMAILRDPLLTRQIVEEAIGIEPQDTLIVLRSKYIELLKDSEKLRRLENGGVDNWDWYEDSLNRDGEDSLEEAFEAIEKEYKIGE